MSFLTIRTAIETLFFADFAAAEPGVDIAVENDNYKPGNNDWVRLSVRFAEPQFLALNNTRQRFRGFLQVQVFTEIGSGTAAETRISDAVSSIFTARFEGGIHYLNTSKTPSIIGEGWQQSTVSCEFWTDI